MNRIRRHLSAKLSIGITLLAAPIFVLALGILFLYSRHLIRQETMKQATGALHTTEQRVKSTMSMVQNAVNSNCWLLEEHFRPDSLESIRQRITLLNRTVSSCSITTDTLEIRKIKEGSVVSITAEGDTIFTYSKALRPDGGDIKGMITATLPFKQLATVISQSKAPTPGSCFLLKKKGERCDETEHLVFYQDLQGIDWNLVLVCPENELLASYHQLFYLGTALLIVGLLLILLICYLMTKNTIRPLHRLLALSKKIVNGQYDEKIPRSMRMDAIGRLQNSFSVMQRSLSEQVGSIRETTEQTQKHNKKLASAMTLAEESVRKKALFIQNVSHQMRTPLNIIMGFADVLGDSLKAQRAGKSQGQLQEQELADIIETMTHNAIHLNRMVQMLCDSSEYGTSHNPTTRKDDCVACNTIAQECIDYARERFPKTSIHLVSELTDSTTIMTNHTLLMRTLRELLFNAAKYSDGQHITLHVTKTETAVRFVVEDVGPGLGAESEELIFKPFMKVDDLSEGLGLGLPLSRSHALRLGGNLTYDSSYHEGCRFILEIPK
jgi:signal transduction histidine kinase